MNGTCTGTIFWVPTPGALGRGQKFNLLNMGMLHEHGHVAYQI